MFGLMKNTGCMKANQQDWYRMHYCGTCKSIGRLYGQKSRLLLNFDCVFLAEILSVVQEEDTEKWDDKLTNHNCFSLPEADALPISLQYAADINLILAEMKVRDNIQDEQPFVWRMAQRVLKKPFNRIHDRLTAWNIDPQVLMQHQAEDYRREKEAAATRDLHGLLSWHAGPTAAITSYLFTKGAEAVEKPHWQEAMGKLGAAFGELVYGLDAWKDVEQDQAQADFNALLLHPGRSMEDSREGAADWLWNKADEIQDIINEAPFPQDIKSAMNSRLMLNLSTSLGQSPKVCAPKSGIEKATIPTIARNTGRTLQEVSRWINPLKPARFAASYLALMLVMFHQHIFAAAEMGAEAASSLNLTMLGVMAAVPVGLYLAARGLSVHGDAIRQKLIDQQEKLKAKERMASQTGRNADWWEIVLIVIGSILAIILLVVSCGSGGGGSCGGGGCDGCNCDGCCGGCSDCDCSGCNDCCSGCDCSGCSC
jgi:hypothetical protein